LIDVADPDEIFTAADFVERATAAVRRIALRGKIPILTGGTPMYYRALEGNVLSADLPSDRDIRAEIGREIEAKGSGAMHAELAAADPEAASRIHPNDAYRVTRALELRRLTGKNVTALYAERGKIGGMAVRYFGVNAPREILYSKIERRAADQFRNGYPEEVEWLLARGYSKDLPSMRGFGYRELALFHEGTMTLAEALQSDIRATKAFSRRQMTWFKQFSPILWYDLTQSILEDVIEDMAGKISSGVLQ
jgi:tRNA dimethylallyltransferase